MNEKLFKTATGAGVCNLVLGIVILTTGIASGVLLLIHAARLLKIRKGLMI